VFKSLAKQQTPRVTTASSTILYSLLIVDVFACHVSIFFPG